MSSSVLAGVEDALHLRAALDLERADGVGLLDLREDLLVVEWDAREVDRLAVFTKTRSVLDALLHRGEHPRPSRSILRKPVSSQESLSHWQSWRPAIAAGWTGTSSTSGRDEITIPPGCWEMWRGSPAISRVSSAKARQRGDVALSSQPGTSASSSATRFAFHPSETRASRSSSPNGSPSALPMSRIAPRER